MVNQNLQLEGFNSPPFFKSFQVFFKAEIVCFS